MTLLFLDDDPTRVPLLPRGIELVYVRTPNEFCDWLKTNGTPEIISFDHDLAPEHYHIGYTGTNEGNGDDCARWTVENGFIPKRAIVHSWNPDGARRIASRLLEAGCEDVFVKPFNPRQRHDWKE